MSLGLLLGDVAYAADQAGKQPEIWEMLLLPASFFLIFYLFLIRPQQRKQKAQQELLATLKAGDEVVTSGGIISRVKSVADTFVTVDTGSNQFLKIQKSHITNLTRPPAANKNPGSSKEKSLKAKSASRSKKIVE